MPSLFFCYNVALAFAVVFIVAGLVLRDLLATLIVDSSCCGRSCHHSPVLNDVARLCTEMAPTPERVPAGPRTGKDLGRVALNLPRLVLPKARTLHDSGTRGARGRDKRSVLFLVFSALEGLFSVAGEDAWMPALLVNNTADLSAGGTWSRVARVGRTARVIAVRGHRARLRTGRDGCVPLLSARHVHVRCTACAAHALCQRALSTRSGVACQRTAVAPTV